MGEGDGHGMYRVITLLDHACDRCGERADLHDFPWGPVVYRGRTMKTPWLCPKCYQIEKRKLWRRGKAVSGP